MNQLPFQRPAKNQSEALANLRSLFSKYRDTITPSYNNANQTNFFVSNDKITINDAIENPSYVEPNMNKPPRVLRSNQMQDSATSPRATRSNATQKSATSPRVLRSDLVHELPAHSPISSRTRSKATKSSR